MLNVMSVTRPVQRGRTWAVSTRKPQATQTAARILRDGGNAFDAAVAAMAVLAVTDAAMTGIGGDANILVYSAKDKKAHAINATGTTPKLASIDWYKEHQENKIPVSDGLLAGTVPGVPAACYLMLERWGTRTFADVTSDGIDLAENGFPVSEFLLEFLTIHGAKLRQYPTSAAIYFPNGRMLKVGDILRNPDLAQTLRTMADPDEFYKGSLARKMASFCEQNGGLFRYEDFARYEAKVDEPISVNYRGYDVLKNPSACQGATELILLNLLEPHNLAALGHNSPAYLDLCIEAAKLAYQDREQYLGDRDFIDIPFDRILAKNRTRSLQPYESTKAGASHAGSHTGDTSYLAIVDKDRNAVSMTPSLHSAFGTGIVIGDTGLIFNCRGDCFELNPSHPNALMPCKRPRSTLTPTLVMKDGELAMVLGSPGGDDQPLRIAQTFLNMVDFGMNIQQAIEAPRWSTTSFPATEFPHTVFDKQVTLEDTIPAETAAALEQKGHLITTSPSWLMGANCGVVIDSKTGVLSAGADPRGDSYALAW
jgi:gamma-glutamyltranspeptidase / glutathione hydrolase